MKKAIKKLCFLPVALPLVFMLFFFGLLPMRFDAVVYTNNIVGEGSCDAYISSVNESFSFLYRGNAYFGSELKTLRIQDLRYNVDTIGLFIYGVSEADIVSFDISVFNITVTHLSKNGQTHPYTRTVDSAVITEEQPIVHLVLEDPNVGESIGVSGFAFIPAWVWIAYFALIFVVSLLLSLGIGFLEDRWSTLALPLSSAAALLVVLITGGFFCGSLPYVDYTDFLLNWMMLLALSLLISAVTLPWIGPLAVTAITAIWYTASYFVISFRGRPIMPADLQAFRTAMEVANGYSFRPTWQLVVGLVVDAAYCIGVVLVSRMNKREKLPLRKNLIVRAVSIVASILMVIGIVHTPAFAKVNTFAWDAQVTESFHREGIVLSFLKNAINTAVKKPEGYSRGVVDDYRTEYSLERTEGTRPINIIMVMNEAFSDLRTVGLDNRIDVMPYIDSLEENTVEGELYVSVFAGGTCNTEFEALTGNSLAFLGVGVYPYMSYVTSPVFSLASYFREQGFRTEAFHSNKAKNWNRDKAYPLLGFEQFNTIDELLAFAPEITLHGLPADIGDYRYMESAEARFGDMPSFLFNVTMQNHSSYAHFLDVPEADTVKEFGSELPDSVRVYLSLIKASDDAVKELIETYQNSDEPTMIVFFGDHQPGIPAQEQSAVYTEVQNNLDYFKTKFFIWTNYPTKAQHDVRVSANYLPLMILEQGNFPLPPYIQMLREVQAQYPVISSQGVIDAAGNVYTNVAALGDDPLIRKYQYVQYANLFDELDPAWFAVD